MKPMIVVLAMVAMVGLMAVDALGYTVAGVGKKGFADFSKAIVFDTTTASCPSNAETIAGSNNSGSHLGRGCAIPMQPVGDGSWVCTANVFVGGNYSYWFEYRIPAFEDTNAWRGASLSGNRTQDQSQQRTIAVPATATNGYIFYNVLGDPDVTGKQGMGLQGTAWDTELTPSNPDVAKYLGTTDVSSSGNNDTTDLGGNNSYNISVTQIADTKVRISWQLKITGGDDIVPTVEGAREFDTTSTYTPYGFRVLRARLASGWNTDTTNPGHLVFEDTVVNQVTGDTLYSPYRPQGAYYSSATQFEDTALPANTGVGDSFVYTVLWADAYGNKNDTSDQNFASGAARWTRGAGVTVIFLVERFDPDVVFPNGATVGRIRVTPWVNGIPQPAYGFWTTAYLASRRST